MKTILLEHVRSRLALHELQDGDGQSLLILHGLGQSSPTSVPSIAQVWQGPISVSYTHLTLPTILLV